eukprot:2922-Heterococcus_DN1.PRE.2
MMLEQSTAKGVHQQPNRKHFSTCILKGCRAQLQMLQLLPRSTVCNTKALYAKVWVLQQAASHENRSNHFQNAPPNLKINVVSTWMGVQVEHLTGNQKVAMLLKKKRGETAEAVLAAAAAAAIEESSRKRAKAVKIETSAAAVVSSKLNQDSFNPMYLLRGDDWDPRSATEGKTDNTPAFWCLAMRFAIQAATLSSL